MGVGVGIVLVPSKRTMSKQVGSARRESTWATACWAASCAICCMSTLLGMVGGCMNRRAPDTCVACCGGRTLYIQEISRQSGKLGTSASLLGLNKSQTSPYIAILKFSCTPPIMLLTCTYIYIKCLKFSPKFSIKL